MAILSLYRLTMPKRRSTKQRELIEQVLHHADQPLLPSELLNRAQQSLPQLGIATVFRTLKKMVDEDMASVVNVPGDSPRYERSGLAHHHHFKCQICENLFEIRGCTGDFYHLLPEGFQLAGHDIILFGHCASCCD